MYGFETVFMFTFSTTSIVVSYILYILIIWYLKTKPLGDSCFFDVITIDTILIRLVAQTIFFCFIIVFLSVDGCELDLNFQFIQPIRGLIIYIPFALHISNEILNSFLRLLLQKRPDLIIDVSDSKIRKRAWIFRITSVGKENLVGLSRK